VSLEAVILPTAPNIASASVTLQEAPSATLLWLIILIVLVILILLALASRRRS